ncbi:hypothetical protein AB0J83_38485 [Actinoplanes sp. NPDC049596]|uniref:hypothetical protein n=1 Tax=unclassified Actinoplanes TaxID=2626549 RepID=UPI003412CFDC
MRRVLLIGSVVAALGVAGTVYAYADWSVPSSRLTVTARVAAMPRGVAPSAAKQNGQAVVSWSAQELVPGVLMDHYVVTAHSVGAPARPDLTHTVAASGAATESVTFAAAAVAGGKWQWTIVPRYATWSGAESKKSQQLSFPGTPAATAVPPVAVAAAVVAPEPAVPAAPVPAPPAVTTSPPTVSEPAPAEATTSPPPARNPEPESTVSPGAAVPEPPPSPVEPSASGSPAADIPE